MCTHTLPTKSPTDLGVYWTNVDKIFVRRRGNGIIVDVKTIIGVALYPSDVECQHTEYDTIRYIYVRSKADDMASLVSQFEYTVIKPTNRILLKVW